MPTRIRSFSKINLGLAIGPSRADGFHALSTAYQTLALHDLVTISARPAPQTSIHLTSNHPGVPNIESGDAEKNTAFRIVERALALLNLTAEVTIEIDKRLPVQGGLGAGSANAAAALIGLEHELSVWTSGPPALGPWALDPATRLALAAETGSDVPLFLVGGTVLGLGRGEEVYPLPDLPAIPCVVAVPAIGVSTAAAFGELDARMPPLTSGANPDRLKELSCALTAAWTATGADLGMRSHPVRQASPSGIASSVPVDQRGDLAENPANLLAGVANPLLALVRTGVANDFEEVVFAQHPSLRSTKRDLMGSGPSQALYAALSGSGSALFGLYWSTADARAAQQRVQASGTQALLTETLIRPEYWRTMLEV